MDVFSIILPIIYTLFGLGLIWFIIELVITIRKVRGEALTVIKDIKPTLDNVENIVSDIQPAIKKIDPLMDRVTLTIDSVNLEMIRVDEILETVTNITTNVNKTTNAVGNITSAPADIITSVTSKIRSKISPKYASESTNSALTEGQNPIAGLADVTIDAASEAFKEQQDRSAARKAHQKKVFDQLDQKNEDLANAANKLSDSIIGQADTDANLYAPTSDEAQVTQEMQPVDQTQPEEQVQTSEQVQPDNTDQIQEQVQPEEQFEQAFASYQEEDVTAPSMGADISSDVFGEQDDTGYAFEANSDRTFESADTFASNDDRFVDNFQNLNEIDVEETVEDLNADLNEDLNEDFDLNNSVYDNAYDIFEFQSLEDMSEPVQPEPEPVIEEVTEQVWANVPAEEAADLIADQGLDQASDQASDQTSDRGGYFQIRREEIETPDYDANAFASQLPQEEFNALVAQEVLHDVFGEDLMNGNLTEEDYRTMQEIMNGTFFDDLPAVEQNTGQPSNAQANEPQVRRVSSASRSGSVRASSADMSSVDVTSVDPRQTTSTSTFFISSDDNGGDSGGIPISDIRIG